MGWAVAVVERLGQGEGPGVLGAACWVCAPVEIAVGAAEGDGLGAGGGEADVHLEIVTS